MGIFFSKKVQRSSKDILEDLEEKIRSKAIGRQRNQQYERSFVSYLLLLSFIVYLVGVAVLYLYFRPSTWPEWLGYLAPLLLFPVVVYSVKKLLNLYFSHRKTQFDQELATLHEEKRKVLNEMMERETYKTAIELLQRFEPTHPSLQHNQTPKQSSNNSQQTPASPSLQGRRSELRQRQTPHPALLVQNTPINSQASRGVHRPQQAAPTATPLRPQEAPVIAPATAVTSNSDSSQQFIPPGMCLGVPPGPPTPVPILPRNRSSVDKMVEYLVGDGPNNRYALVCIKCHSHNGMALRDEFEYMTFRCAYCFHLNSARKKKPTLATPPEDKPTLSDSQAAEVAGVLKQSHKHHKRKADSDDTKSGRKKDGGKKDSVEVVEQESPQ